MSSGTPVSAERPSHLWLLFLVTVRGQVYTATIGTVDPKTRRLIVTSVLLILVVVAMVGALGLPR